MSPEQWDIVRKNADTVMAQRDALRKLLNRARLSIPSGYEIRSEIAEALGLMTDCICVTRGGGEEGCGFCNETGKRPTSGITITLGYSKVYNGLHLQKWENHGLSEGTYRLVVVEDGKG